MLEAIGISKHFGRRKVLSGVDLRVEEGEIVALMGPNGAGKTTLLRILSTLLQPSSGDVLLDGRSIYEDPPIARRSIGVVGHSTYTYDDLTALENLRFYWGMYSMRTQDFAEAGPGMLRRLGLGHRMNDRVSFFSKGMRQRLAFARALVHSPKVLLLDEPFSSLDQKGVDIFSQILLEERSRGRSVIIVTHDVQRISALADRADILVDGRISHSFSSEAIRRGELELSYKASAEGGIS